MYIYIYIYTYIYMGTHMGSELDDIPQNVEHVEHALDPSQAL